MNTLFQQTANCQFTICLTRGVHPNTCQAPFPTDLKLSPLSSTPSPASPFADFFRHLSHNDSSGTRVDYARLFYAARYRPPCAQKLIAAAKRRPLNPELKMPPLHFCRIFATKESKSHTNQQICTSTFILFFFSTLGRK